MPALGAGIHVFALCEKDVDGRDKPGHDGGSKLNLHQRMANSE
jgi:hypothetical protein